MISISKNLNTVPWKYAVEDLNDGNKSYKK